MEDINGKILYNHITGNAVQFCNLKGTSNMAGLSPTFKTPVPRNLGTENFPESLETQEIIQSNTWGTGKAFGK